MDIVINQATYLAILYLTGGIIGIPLLIGLVYWWALK